MQGGCCWGPAARARPTRGVVAHGVGRRNGDAAKETQRLLMVGDGVASRMQRCAQLVGDCGGKEYARLFAAISASVLLNAL